MIDGPFLADPALGTLADMLDDLEETRKANVNRMRALTDNDHGLTLDNPDVARLQGLVDGVEGLEKQVIKELEKAIKRHPLGGWVEDNIGVGAKQGARFLAVLRDPYWNDLHNRSRSLRELYAYCGEHVVNSNGDHHDSTTGGYSPKRAKGAKANWNPTARMRGWLITESCIKQYSSPYRAVYDLARERYADAIHTEICVRCGPKGKPAQPGSVLSLGHQKARAQKLMRKAMLRDLWEMARKLHEEV